VTYRLQLSDSHAETTLAERAQVLLAMNELWVDRARPKPRRMNLRPYIDQIRVLPNALEMDLWVTPNDTARPSEILERLELADVLSQGAIIERLRVELEVEIGQFLMDGEATGNSAPTRANRDADSQRGCLQIPASNRLAAVSEGRPMPLIPGPLDY